MGEDYSELLKKPSNQEEEPTSKTEKNSELPAASQLPENQEDLKAEVQTQQTPPSSPRSPPSPTSPTSPPSPVSPASPASPTSPGSGSPPAPTEAQLAAGKLEQQKEAEAEKKSKDVEEEDATTSSSTVMLIDVCPKTGSNSVYTR